MSKQEMLQVFWIGFCFITAAAMIPIGRAHLAGIRAAHEAARRLYETFEEAKNA